MAALSATQTERPTGLRDASSVAQASRVQQNTQTQTLESAQLTSNQDATSNAITRNAKNDGNAQLKAKVTNGQTELVSQPGSNLAASAVVAAQANQNNKVGGDATLLPAGDFAGDGAEPFLTGSVGRQSGKQGPNSHQHGNLSNKGANQAKPDAQGALTGASTSAAQTAQQAAANANQRNNLFAATLSRANPSGAQQGLQPLSGDIGVGPGSNGQPQAQRLTDTPQPQRAKPQLPPRFVSDQVSVQVQRAIGQGNDRISIQLKPAELGRVEVKLEIAHDGKVNAVISAERPETLELLKQDARSLQQSLQQADLNADSSSLSFNLQQRGGAFEQALGRNGGQQSNDADNQGTADDTDQQAAGSRNIISDDMVDVEV